MRADLGTVIILALLLSQCQAAAGFSSFKAAGGDIHDQITREALAGTISDTNLDFIIKACDSQDAPGSEGAGEPRRHCDNGNLSGAVGYIERERKRALNYAADCDSDPENRAQCLRHFGLLLHTVQDFYSRTNYVEMQLENPAEKLSPYSIELVDWARVPDGYIGRVSGQTLISGRRAGWKASDSPPGFTYEELNKDNPDTPEGKKTVAGWSYFNIARDLATRETERQWTLFEALVRGRFQQRADALLAALKRAGPANGVAPDSAPQPD